MSYFKESLQSDEDEVMIDFLILIFKEAIMTPKMLKYQSIAELANFRQFCKIFAESKTCFPHMVGSNYYSLIYLKTDVFMHTRWI